MVVWLGLVIGVLTLPMPFTVTGAPAAKALLASIHLVTGAVWFLVLRRRED